jgi:TusA-related sulfurtransferase
MAAYELDVRGEICPDPLHLTLKRMEMLASGDTLKVITDSPTALETISHWAKKAGHRVMETRDRGSAEWEILLQVKS